MSDVFYLMPTKIEKEYFVELEKEKLCCFCCLSNSGPFVNLPNCSHTHFLEASFKLYDLHSTVVCYVCHNELKNITRFQQQVAKSYSILKDEDSKNINLRTYRILSQSKVEITSTKTSPPKKLLTKKSTSKKLLTKKSPPKKALTKESPPKELKQNVPAMGLTETCETDDIGVLKTERDSCSDLIETDDNDLMKTERDSRESSPDGDMPLAKLPKQRTVKGNKRKRDRTIKKNLTRVNNNKNITKVTLTHEEMEEERERERNKPTFLNKLYKCTKCIVGFGHEQNLMEHNERHVMKPDGIKCKICEAVFVLRSSYLSHWNRHFTRFVCNDCGTRMTSYSSALIHHSTQHDRVKFTFRCGLCDFVTNSQRSFRYHKMKHKPKIICNECGKGFTTSSTLKIHMFIVHKQSNSRFPCDSCPKIYLTPSALKSHVESNHTKNKKVYFCELCKNYYKTSVSYNNHFKTSSKHASEWVMKFECAECGSKYRTRSQLQDHMNIVHIGVLPEKCSKCDKAYINKLALKRHVQSVHDKKRPQRTKICDHCGKAFTTNAILTSHIRTHTGERPLVCTMCNATFAHKGALYTHIKLLHKRKDNR